MHQTPIKVRQKFAEIQTVWHSESIAVADRPDWLTFTGTRHSRNNFEIRQGLYFQCVTSLSIRSGGAWHAECSISCHEGNGNN